MFDHQTIEFVGGPYDGYRQDVEVEPQVLLPNAWVPVSVNTIRAVCGEEHGSLFPCRRMARYDLCCSHGVWQYHFQEEKITHLTL